MKIFHLNNLINKIIYFISNNDRIGIKILYEVLLQKLLLLMPQKELMSLRLNISLEYLEKKIIKLLIDNYIIYGLTFRNIYLFEIYFIFLKFK